MAFYVVWTILILLGTLVLIANRGYEINLWTVRDFLILMFLLVIAHVASVTVLG